MRKEYQTEIDNLKDRMEKAEAFAEKVQMFAERIIEGKITGEELWLKYIESYKKVRTFNGVSRGFFKTDTPRRMTNNNDYHEGYFWTVYINTLGEYDSHANYGLKEIPEITPIYYFDSLNSTFYCTDEQIEAFLEALNEWKIKAVKQAKEDRIDEDIREAKNELEEAQNKYDKLNKLEL